METILNCIAGRMVEPQTGAYLENLAPATGQPYSRLPDSGPEDVAAAVEAAQAALPDWSGCSPDDRAAILGAIAGRLEAAAADFARAEAIDAGKLLTLTTAMDIPRAVGMLRFYAQAIRRDDGGLPVETTTVDSPRAVNRTVHHPLGVVASISPWNLPLYLLVWKAAPAIATGNCVVAKPSELTPMTASMFAELCLEAGLPPGVLNVVQGIGAKVGPSLVTHPDVRGVTFTGSTATGADIARRAAPLFKRLSLELGGKNATVVFADADHAGALETSVRAAFANQGQLCLCGARLLVERPIYDRLRDDLVARVSRMKPGDPMDRASTQGAIVSSQQLEKVERYVALAREQGGRILTGGERVRLPPPHDGGFYYAPTLIEGLPPDSVVNQEEIFGPVLTLIPFSSEQEAVRIANGTRYGLTATVLSRDAERADRVARALRAGTVWVNCWLVRDIRAPFGGVKDSGIGREGGIHSLRFFTEPQNVCTSITE